MFKDKIRMLRISRRMSQYDLAAAVGVTQGSVSHWENGRAFPEMPVLQSLSAHFGVSMDELMDGDIPPSSPPTQEAKPVQNVPYEIRILHRGNTTMTQEQLDRREALMRVLWEMDDDGLDTAERLINIVNGKKD